MSSRTWGRSIEALYFDYRPVAEHEPSCPLHGSNVWEVSRYRHAFSWEQEAGKGKTVYRYSCNSCKVVHFEGFEEEEASRQTVHASSIGWGMAPSRMAGLFLHPGPPIWQGDDRGPCTFYITAGPERPTSREDVIGAVGWGLGRNGGMVWSAGFDMTESHTFKVTETKFRSRGAAVKWVAAQNRAADGSGEK